MSEGYGVRGKKDFWIVTVVVGVLIIVAIVLRLMSGS